MDNSYKRLGLNTLLVFIGNIGPRLVAFILMPFYTFWMSKEEFGIQDVILTYSVLLIPYFTLGLYEAVFVFPKEKEKQIQAQYFSSALFTISIVISVGISIILLLPDSILTLILPQYLRSHLPFLLLIIVLESFQRVIQSFTRGIDKMKSFSIAGCIHACVMLVMAVTFVRKYGLYGFWLSLLAADTSAIVYNFLSIKGWTYITSRFESHLLNELLKYSIPLVPNATMWWIVNSINRPLLLSNIGLDGVGVYAVAGKFPSIISLVFTVFFSAFQISALEEYGKDSFNRFYNNVFKVLAYSMLVITCSFIAFGGLLFDVFVDVKFHEGVFYLPILCTGVVLSNLSTFVGIGFTITKESKYFLYSAIIAAIVAVVFNSLLIPEYGIMGACISIVLSQMSMLSYRWYKSRKIVEFSNYMYIVKMLLCFVSILLVYYLCDSMILSLLAVAMVLLYATFLNNQIFDFAFKLLKK